MTQSFVLTGDDAGDRQEPRRNRLLRQGRLWTPWQDRQILSVSRSRRRAVSRRLAHGFRVRPKTM